MKKRIHYMIHASVEREQYVKDILVPSLVAQGIKRNDIYVWVDVDGKGEFNSFIESCRWICETQESDDYIWYLQGDVVVSKDFAKVSRQVFSSSIVCGFCNSSMSGGRTNAIGNVPKSSAWLLFHCVRVRNSVIGDFLEWAERNAHSNNVADAFREFFKSTPWNYTVTNLSPNVVDCIDYLLDSKVHDKHVAYWRSEELDEAVHELGAKLEMKD